MTMTNMTTDLIRHNRRVSDELHPFVYWAMVGLALWFVLSAWLLFGGAEYMGLLLAMVSVLLLIAVAVPSAIWLSWRKFPGSGAAANQSGTVREWMAGDFETWQGRVSGREAAIEILLPLAAVAFGLSAFGIALHFAVTKAV